MNGLVVRRVLIVMGVVTVFVLMQLGFNATVPDPSLRLLLKSLFGFVLGFIAYQAWHVWGSR